MLRGAAAATVAALLAGAGHAIEAAHAAEHVVFFGKRPEHLGLRAGKLAPCPSSPNCVSSQADPSDSVHYVAPIAFDGEPAAAMAAVRAAIEATPGATIVREEADYLHAEFRTRVLRFVDDVEFAFDAGARVIHVRSASRVGWSDLGANRRRVEALRARIETPKRT
ncbi:MAG: DUF1499 domain-containing protein [Burkholderiales bacterium]|nr:DUF1499 domain-containing protein [Burkholderiales bacterium]